MRLNNAVEEALGSGEGHHNGGAGASDSSSPFAFATAGGTSEMLERPASLKINHAEDEHYGSSRHA